MRVQSKITFPTAWMLPANSRFLADTDRWRDPFRFEMTSLFLRNNTASFAERRRFASE
jgi:hypothetical protein